MLMSVNCEAETDAPRAERPPLNELFRMQPAARETRQTTGPRDGRAQGAPLAPDHPRTGPHPTD